DEAFFICDLRDLEQKIKLWQKELPQVTPYYGKAVPHLLVYVLHLRLRTSLIYKKEELKIVVYEHDLNVLFCRYLEEIGPGEVRARCLPLCFGCACSRDAEMLSKVGDIKHFVKLRSRAQLLLRIAASEFGSRYTMNEKFGACSHEIENILKVVLKLGRNVVGVAFHVGCAYHHPDIFVRTIDHAKQVFDMGNEMAFRMNVLDIGGGFPGGVRKQDRLAEAS
ncbi:unnamed protein product, partial [Ixodes persulcatus]